VTYFVNMQCLNCKKRIEKNISFEKGVKDLCVDLENKTVSITYNSKKTTEEKLKTSIKELGYTVEVLPEGINTGK
jgi:mercuric ion binding protein